MAFDAQLNLSDVDGNNGFVINGISEGDNFGQSVSAAGDINGDGIDDIIISANFANDKAGQSYVVFGRIGGFGPNLNVSSLNGDNGFVINAANAGDYSGWSVSNAGDVNGDGIDDLVIGAVTADADADASIFGAGKSYVVFGRTGGFGASLNVSSLNGSNGFVINGISEGDNFGRSVSNAGDINGDGIDDLLISAPGGDFGTFDRGIDSIESYVVFGRTGGFGPSLNVSSLNGSNGFVINGIESEVFNGLNGSNAGDVNGDGIDDLIIGIPSSNINDNRGGGISYVVFGRTGGFGSSLNVSSLNGSNGFVINGITEGDNLGSSVSTAGDINGDGIDDFIIGERSLSIFGNTSKNVGKSYVVFGRTGGFGSSLNVSSLNGNNGFVINAANAGDFIGSSVSTAGDVNGDGIDDIIIGQLGGRFASYSDSGPGKSYVVFGRTDSFESSLNLSSLNGRNGFVINGTLDNFYGLKVSNAGDVNGDGTDDIIIGEPRRMDRLFNLQPGKSYVVFGISEKIIVNSSSDESAANRTISPKTESGEITLRSAIEFANSNPGQDTILFNLPEGSTKIEIESPLEEISDEVIIDGFSQPGANVNGELKHIVEIDGSQAGNVTSGLTISASKSTIKGLTINNFGAHGIRINGGTDNTIENNRIGTDIEGKVDLGNGASGILLDSASNNEIKNNLISGNEGAGIRFFGSNLEKNKILDNFIGTDVTGTKKLGNTRTGIFISGADDTTLTGNLISGNSEDGIVILQSSNTQVEDNKIGTNIEGNKDLGNSQYGIVIEESNDNQIGDSIQNGNTISYNGADQKGGGIVVKSGTGNSILGNSFSKNEGLPIDLNTDGQSANDLQDLDTGPNNIQNYPLSAIVSEVENLDGSKKKVIKGLFNSNANSNFKFEFYFNNNENQTFIGFLDDVNTDPSGYYTVNQSNEDKIPLAFIIDLDNVTDQDLAVGTQLALTATNKNTNDTSELSPIEVYEVNTTSDASAINPFLSPDISPETGLQISFRSMIEFANRVPGKQTVRFNIPENDPNYFSDEIIINLTKDIEDISDSINIEGAILGFNVEGDIFSNNKPVINIDGTNAPKGINIVAGNSTIKGLKLSRFAMNAIQLNNVGMNIVQSNLIEDSISSGIYINSSDNLIGGDPSKESGNKILRNLKSGISVAFGEMNQIVGNNIVQTESEDLIEDNNLAIDLNDDGYIGNNISDGGPNRSLNHPVLTHVSFDENINVITIKGNLTGKPLDAYRIELFANNVGSNSYLLGSLNVNTDKSGNINVAKFGDFNTTNGLVSAETGLLDTEAQESRNDRYIEGFTFSTQIESQILIDFLKENEDFLDDIKFTATATDTLGNTSEYFPINTLKFIQNSVSPSIARQQIPNGTPAGLKRSTSLQYVSNERFTTTKINIADNNAIIAKFDPQTNINDLAKVYGIDHFNWVQFYQEPEFIQTSIKTASSEKLASSKYILDPIVDRNSDVVLTNTLNNKSQKVETFEGSIYDPRSSETGFDELVYYDSEPGLRYKDTRTLRNTQESELLPFLRFPNTTKDDALVYFDAPTVDINFAGVNSGYSSSFETRLIGVTKEGNFIDWSNLGTSFTWKSDALYSGSITQPVQGSVSLNAIKKGLNDPLPIVSGGIYGIQLDNSISKNEKLIFIDNSIINENSLSDGEIKFTISLSSESESVVSVDYFTDELNAEAGNDFINSNGTVIFNPGETSKEISISINDDFLPESHEQFVVELVNPVNASISDNFGIGTIYDDDNNIPSVINDFVTTKINSSTIIDVLANDIDVDNDALSIFSFSDISTEGGNISLDNKGTLDLADDTLLYTPPSEFIGTDSFIYSASDDYTTSAAIVEVSITSADIYDYGDAPDLNFGTTLSNDGARHILGSGLYLGNTVDSELDGQPNIQADGDDITGENDDDGVIFSTLTGGNIANARVIVTGSDGLLDAWIDFNGDGRFESAEERITAPIGTTVRNGENNISFNIPKDSVETAYARFRLSSSGNLAPNGVAADGEVEDYLVQIASSNTPPQANEDSYRASEDASLFIDASLGVLINDEDTQDDVLVANLEKNPSFGKLLLNEDGSFTYTPNANFNGSDSFTYTVSDGEFSDTATVNIDVTPVNDAPILTSIGDLSIEEGSELSFTASATDVDLPADTLTFSLSEAPDGAGIDPITGEFSWTPSETQGPETYTFDVIVTDDGLGTLSDQETITITVTEDPSEPEPLLVEGTTGRDRLTGTTVDEIFVGGLGRDTVTGGGGNDEFVYATLNDRIDLLTDFTTFDNPEESDKINLQPLLESLGFEGVDPFTSGIARVIDGRGSADFVQIDADGAGNASTFVSFIQVLNPNDNFENLNNANNFTY